MPKKIKNLVEVRAIVNFDEGTANYHIEDVSIHCGMSCEYGDLGRAGMPLEQNPEIMSIVKDFLEESIKQKETAEGIADEDSMLNANGDVHYVSDEPPGE